MPKTIIKKFRRIRHFAAKYRVKATFNRWSLVASGLILIAGSIVITMQKQKEIDASPLLSVIAKGESRGNYNAYFGNVNNSDIKFTHMSVEEVLTWQKKIVAQGQPSSAVGKYQFIQPTLEGLVRELDISPKEKFNEKLQDRLARRLLERRGLNEFMDREITSDQFAHNLSKEWAALPRVIGGDPSKSYYNGDGLNQAQITVDEIKDGVAAVSEVKGE